MRLKDALDKLSELPLDTTLFYGLGNRLRQDDQVGLFIIQELRKADPNILACSEEDLSVESLLLALQAPAEHQEALPDECQAIVTAQPLLTDIVLIDAAKLDADQQLVLLDNQEIEQLDGTNSLSTHQFPLHLVAHMLQDLSLNVHLLAIGICGIEVNEPLTDEVEGLARHVLAAILGS